ncbi:hypothetical protein FOZ63_014316, partial [Perkinsus olseni]
IRRRGSRRFDRVWCLGASDLSFPDSVRLYCCELQGTSRGAQLRHRRSTRKRVRTHRREAEAKR